jgi:hyperosmotically inducible protein
MKTQISPLAPMVLALVAISPICRAQEGPAERAGQAIDKAGKSIRRGVENAVARGQATLQEADLLARVYGRIHWDKALVKSTLELEVRADGTAILRGTVVDATAKKRAVELAKTTVGITSVVDELLVAKTVPNPPPIPDRDLPVNPQPSGAKAVSKP